jgi:branched-chain amino acid transport system permease protein
VAKLTEILFNGIALGSIYALIALGFVIIFKVSGVFNFAHGSLLLFGGYLIATLHDDLGFAAAAAIAVAATAILAGLVEALLLRGLGRNQVAALTILTIGVDILIIAELGRRIGGDVLVLGDPWAAGVTALGGISVADARIASIAVSLVLIGVFFAVFRWSRWGLAMRATAADREAAALMGVRLDRVQLAAWCIAGILATVAAVFLAAFPSAGLDRTTGQVALKAFPAAVLGGMDSTSGALLGSMIIGLTEALVAGYQSQLTFLGGGIGDVAPYIVMLLVLLVLPNGLLGSKELARV